VLSVSYLFSSEQINPKLISKNSVSLFLKLAFMKKIIVLLLAITSVLGCKQPQTQAQSQPTPALKSISIPSFSGDSAYSYTKAQVDFGARVPNTKSHEQCAKYLTEKLKEFGAVVVEQKIDLQAFDGTVLHSVNIIGSFNPQASKRVLLYSHWESRPWADNDPIPANRKKPVMAANDGASGVAVLLEMARLMGKNLPSVGVDIIFFDAEDYGAPEWFRTQQNTEDTWCLGTQYWARNPHVAGYKAEYGILLDMVGAPDATFYREQVSEHFASNVLSKVWSQAASLGFEKYFMQDKGGAITDDHVYVNQIAGIPSIDIIDFKPQAGGFGKYWHTTHDTMDNVDKNTLQAVGMTLMNVIYNEPASN
jgi:Peptidase family M28